MITIDGKNWKTAKQPIYADDHEINMILANSQYRLYPDVNVGAAKVINGLSYNGDIYLPPARMHLPGATLGSDGIYYETVDFSSYELLKGKKFTNTNTKQILFWGIYKIAEAVTMTPITCSFKGISNGTFTIAYTKDGATETMTVNKQGDTYMNIIYPTINRYFLVNGDITIGKEGALPSWVRFDKYKDGWYPLGTVKGSPRANLAPELFLTTIEAPLGGEFITGGFKEFPTNSSSIIWESEPRGMVGGGINPTSDGTQIAAEVQTMYVYSIYQGLLGGYTFGKAPTYDESKYKAGKEELYGCIGSAVTGVELKEYGNYTEELSNIAGQRTGGYRFIKSDGTLTQGISGTVGEIHTQIDNVITGFSTQKNFLWYNGSLK